MSEILSQDEIDDLVSQMKGDNKEDEDKDE